MNNELNALADLLHACGWTSPNDAQWLRLDAVIPTIRNLLSRPAPAPVAVPDGMDAVCGAGFEALRSRGFRVNASDMSCDDLAAVFKAMYEAAAPSAPATVAICGLPVVVDDAMPDDAVKVTSGDDSVTVRYASVVNQEMTTAPATVASEASEAQSGRYTPEQIATVERNSAEREAAGCYDSELVDTLRAQLAERDEQLADLRALYQEASNDGR